MKKRNLFLSLICSVILTIALVTFTVVSLVPKKDNGDQNGPTSGNVSDTGSDVDITINEERDGSLEKPYVIYSADSFKTYVVDKYIDENGEYIDYTKVDEESGELVYPELNAGLYYELDRDIDFAGVEFSTIFNKGIAFNGHINGNGHVIKNINISVTKDNIVDVAYSKDSQLVANVGIFGEINGAEIKNISIVDATVSMEEGLYSHIWSAEFRTDNGTMKSIAVGTLAGVAKNSTIEANVSAKLTAFAYSVYENERATGLFAVGGLVAAADTCTIANSNVDVEIVADQGARYFVGGIAGSAFDTTITATVVDADITTHYEQALYVAGAVGYTIGLNMEDVTVNFAIVDNSEERYNTKGITSINNNSFVSIAGAVHTINVDNTAVSIKNVTVKANADIDGVYAGAVMDIINTNGTVLVELTDLIVDSEVNVLKGYGFARKLYDAKVTLSRVEVELIDEVETSFNVRMTGKVRLDVYKSSDAKMLVASVFALEMGNTEIAGMADLEGNAPAGYRAVNAIVSYQIYSKLTTDTFRPWGSFVKV